MLMMLGAAVACANSKTADADDARCICSSGMDRARQQMLKILGAFAEQLMLMMLAALGHWQGAKGLLLPTMLGAFVACAKSRTADADDAQCVWRTGRKQTS